jgi:hypothetical protein
MTEEKRTPMQEFGDFVVYGPKGNKMKTSELEGVALNWAVDRCLPDELLPADWPIGWGVMGPIIEREQIKLWPYDCAPNWKADLYNDKGQHFGEGPTPLVAAMRCFVASKLGDEVEIPEK